MLRVEHVSYFRCSSASRRASPFTHEVCVILMLMLILILVLILKTGTDTHADADADTDFGTDWY